MDTLADIIKDQLFVNPLEYLEAENLSEVECNCINEMHSSPEHHLDLGINRPAPQVYD